MHLPIVAAILLSCFLSSFTVSFAGDPARSVHVSSRHPLRGSGACSVLCNDTVLQAFYQAGLMVNDSKPIVDRPLLEDPEVILSAFDQLPMDAPPEIIELFVEKFFGATGSDLIPWLPSDYSPTLPPALQPQNLKDPRVAQLAADLHPRWQMLGRQPLPDVAANPQRHTLLSTPFPIVVPGGRFMESYYWDTYWIILGLKASNMTETAQNVARNLLDFVARFGFVPNGGRQYYLDRSQPPFLTLMIAALANADPLRNTWYNKTASAAASATAFTPSEERVVVPWLDEFFQECLRNKYAAPQALHESIASTSTHFHRSRRQLLHPNQGHSHKSDCNIDELVTRRANMKDESFSSTPSKTTNLVQGHTRESMNVPSVSSQPDMAFIMEALPQLEAEYRFWMTPTNQHIISLPRTDGSGVSDSLNRYFVNTSTPRPEGYAVDLTLSEELNSIQTPEEFFSGLAAGAESGMDFSSRWFRDGFNETTIDTPYVVPVDLNSILCRVELTLAHFYTLLEDYPRVKQMLYAVSKRIDGMQYWMWDEKNTQWRDWNTKTEESGELELASNFSPLWSGCFDPVLNINQVVDRLVNKSGLWMVGGVATSMISDQAQWDYPNAWPPLVHMFVEALGRYDQFASTAQDMAGRWMYSNWLGLQKTGQMHEKYDARHPGERGAGGEYKPQVGFGWSNGVALDFIMRYGSIISLPNPQDSNPQT